MPHFCKFCCLFFLELREISRARFTVWHTPLIPMDFRYWASCSKEIKPQSGLNLDDHTDNYRTKFHQQCPRKYCVTMTMASENNIGFSLSSIFSFFKWSLMINYFLKCNFKIRITTMKRMMMRLNIAIFSTIIQYSRRIRKNK